MLQPVYRLIERTLPQISTHLVLLNQMNEVLKTVLPQTLHEFCVVANFSEETAFLLLANNAVYPKIYNLQTRILKILKCVRPSLSRLKLTVSPRAFLPPSGNSAPPPQKRILMDEITQEKIRQQIENTPPDFKNVWNALLNNLKK